MYCLIISSCAHSLPTPAGDTERIKGCWDSIHVVEVQEKGRSAHYKLTSTVMLWLQTIKAGSGTMNLGGSLFRQVGGVGCHGSRWVVLCNVVMS